MDGNNWRADQGQVNIPGMEGGDWRTELQPETRQRVVNEILETLKSQDGLQELKNIAVRFEERIYTAATSQQDYLRKNFLKRLTMKSNAASNSRNPHDSAAQSMQSQIQNKVQQPPIPMGFNQSQVQQQLLSQTMPNSVGGMSQGTMPVVPGKIPNMQQNMSNVIVNAYGNSMGQGLPSKQQQLPWNMANMLHNQGQQPQPMQQQQQLMQLQQLMQQQQLMQYKSLKPSGQKQLLQRGVPLSNAIGGDWQEKIYQKHNVLPQQLKNEQLEKLGSIKEKFECIISTLKNEVQPHHKEKVVGLEKLIEEFLNFNRLQKPVSSFQQGLLVPPPVHAMQQSQISQMKANKGLMSLQMKPMNGSHAAEGEDLASMTKCHLQEGNFSQDGPSGAKRMRQFSSAMSSNVVSSTGSMNDRFRHLTVNEPDGASSVKSPRIEMESRVETTEKGLADALAQVTKLQPCLTKLDHIEEMLTALLREKSTSPQPAPAAVLPIPSCESVVIGPKLDFPIFDAEDPVAWLSRVNSYFWVHKTDERARIELALAAMDGPALHWMQSILRRRPVITWKKFGFELLRWYGKINPAVANRVVSLPAITQTGSVDEYVDMFMSRTAHAQQLPDSQSLALFLNGLRDDIRVRLSGRYVTNTFDAIHLALEIERELLSAGTACPGKGMIELSHADCVELLSKGLCFKCREPCQPLHSCSGKNLRVVIAAAEEDGGDETMACGEVPGPEAT